MLPREEKGRLRVSLDENSRVVELRRDIDRRRTKAKRMAATTKTTAAGQDVSR
jgi:hypothetical protein